MKRLAATAACFGLLTGLALGRDAQRLVAITHVSVVPMDRETVLEDMTVLVADEKIAGLFASNLGRIPDGAEVIDGSGKYLLPGLMDMHVHSDDPKGAAYFAKHGITTVRVMGGSPEVLAAGKAVREGEIFGPLIVSATPPFQQQEYEGTWQATDVASAREGVRKYADQGYEWVKVIRLSDEALAATVMEAKRHGLVVGGHLRFDQSLESFMDAGVKSVEHIEEAMWAAFGSSNPTEKEMRRVAKELREADVTVSTLLWSGILGSDMRLMGEGALETAHGKALAVYLGEKRAEKELRSIAKQLHEQKGVGRESQHHRRRKDAPFHPRAERGGCQPGRRHGRQYLDRGSGKLPSPRS